MLGSIIEIRPQGPIISFVFDDSIKKLLRFHETILYEEYNLSTNPVDYFSFDNIFIHTNLAQGMILKSRRSGIIHNFTMDVDPEYKYIEKLRGGVQWYLMEPKDFISSKKFILKNENGNLVSFNDQINTFRFSIREI